MIPDQKTLSVCSLGELWLEGAEAGYDSNGWMGEGGWGWETDFFDKDIIDVLVSLIGPEVVWKIGVSVERTIYERWIALTWNAKFGLSDIVPIWVVLRSRRFTPQA